MLKEIEAAIAECPTRANSANVVSIMTTVQPGALPGVNAEPLAGPDK
jgi:hypothetical protein